MTNHFVRKLHESLEIGSLKRRVGEVLESRKVEVLIIALVFTDLILLLIEGGIDMGLLCINGVESDVPPGELVKMGGSSLVQLSDAAAGWRPWASHAGLSHGVAAGLMSLAFRDDAGMGPLGFAFLQTNATQSDVPTYHHSKARAFHAVAEDTILAHPVHADGTKHRATSSGRAMKEVRHEKIAHHETLREESHGAHEEAHGEAHGEEHAAHGEHGEGHGHGHHHAGSLVCEDEHGPATHETLHFCHTASITILTIFLIEILAKFWVNPKEFVRSPVELLDLTVVTLSLIVDAVILPMVHDPKQKAELHAVEVLLMLCRGWRVVRIFHGIFEIAHHQIEEHEKLEHQLEAMCKTIAEHNREDPEEVRERYAMLAKSHHSH